MLSADILIHVIDATREETLADSILAVTDVLADLAASKIPCILAFNKIDAIEPGKLSYLKRAYPDAMPISAITGAGVGELLVAVSGYIGNARTVTLAIPGEKGDILSALYREGSVISRELDGDKVVLRVSLPSETVSKYLGYLADDARNVH